MADAKTWATNNLSSFKQRMRISTEDSDELANLTDMLTASYTSILRLIGVSDASDPEVKELIFERSRYTYNDALDEPTENSTHTTRDVSISTKPTDDVEATQ